jgi:hypothetical protein
MPAAPSCGYLGKNSTMITRKIFLASSSELKEDRTEFEIFISRKNKDLVQKEMFLETIMWEDFLDAMSRTRLQDEYNKAIQGCDIFVMLFSTKVGQYTEEEFETAFGQFKTTKKPLIYTYFKDTVITTGSLNRKNLRSLWAFQDKLNNLGHFCTGYKNIDDLKFQFDQQLNKLEASGAFTRQIGDRVLALWKSDGYWYPGTVTGIREKRFLIKYDDGNEQWLTAENITSLEYRVGDAVACRWKGLVPYYPAHIIEIKDENNLTVQYDHDDSPSGPSLAGKEQTTLQRLRVSR